jgi:general secretion pathway protein D
MKEAMVARANKQKGLNLFASLLVGALTQPLALLAAPNPMSAPQAEREPLAVAQLIGGSPRGHAALNAGIEAQQRGDYDTAAGLFQQARSRLSDLTPAEQDELKRWLTLNAQALQVRRQAGEQLRLAEQALQQGRRAEAVDLLKRVSGNDLYLSAADKRRFQELDQKLHLPAGTATGGHMDPSAQAHAKVAQARAELAKGDLDAAETLAHEAEQTRVPFAPMEDSPARILEESAKAHKDPRTLLMAARATMQRGDLNRAENYARLAEKLGSSWSFPLWGDTPSKVMKDIQAARAAKPTSAPVSPAAPPAVAVTRSSNSSPAETVRAATPATAGPNLSPPPAPGYNGSGLATTNPNPDTEKARALLQQGRKALAAGKREEARQCAEQAAALKTDLHWSDDNPARLLADIARAEASAKPAAGASGTEAIRTKEQALTLLRQGREQLAQNKIEDAEKTVARLKSANNIHWGLFFDDTPDKLLHDVERQRAQRNKDRATELLAEGRRLFEKKDYTGAEKLAFQAQKLHGPYTVWDLGDQPGKLLADVQKERQKAHHLKLPDAPVVVKGAGDKATPQGSAGTAVARTNPAMNPMRNPLMPGGTPAATNPPANVLVRNTLPPGGANGPQVPPGPGALTPPPANPAVAQNSVPFSPPVGGAGQPNPAVSSNVAQGRQLMREARLALLRGDAPRARLLADQVRTMNVVLNVPGEDTPDTIYRDLARLAPAPANVAPGTALAGMNPSTMGQQPMAQPRPPVAVNDPNAVKRQALQLVAEARMLQQQNRLIEARQKIVEAQRLGAPFRSDEDNPDHAYQQVALAAKQRIDGLVNQAGDVVRYGKGAQPVRCQEAERGLLEARQLAAAFGQDPNPIERTMQLVGQLKNNNASGVMLASNPPPGAYLPSPGGERMPVTAPAVNSSQLAHGQKLLDDARLELRKGETATARRLAEEACGYGVREDALMVLRTIDTEEFNQRRLRAKRAFEAVEAAYRRQDFTHAAIMLAAIDTRLLDLPQQARLREIANTPQMQPSTRQVALANGGQEVQEPRDVQAQRPALNPQLVTPPVPGQPGAGHARATDHADQSLLAHTQAMREIKFQKLRKDGLEVQSQAAEKFRTGQTDAALEMLQDYLAQLTEEQLDPGQTTLLRRPIESRLSQFRLLKAQADFANQSADNSRTQMNKVKKRLDAEQLKQKNVAELMKQFNELFKSGKYVEAEALAMRAKEIDPDNPVATSAVYIARMQRNRSDYNNNKENKEKLVLDTLNDTDREGNPDAIKFGMTFETDPERRNLIRNRKGLSELHMPRRSVEERNIERKLTAPVNLNFTNAPLRTVIDDLRAFQGINIYVDEPALAEQGVSLDHPVSIKLEQISLKSALNLLLRSTHLTYVIKDEVLQITTESQARGKNELRVYQVADLVIPVDNYGSTGSLPAVMMGQQNNNSPNVGVPSPVTGPYTLNGGQPVGAPTGSSMSGGGSGFAADSSGNQMQVTKTRPTQTNEAELMKLIMSTVSPRSWAEMGGPGTIDYHPMTMSLAINQTPDIQDQIADLLAALRRLQDQEVAVEVKFITVSEEFFERIGVNFNLNILSNNQRYQPALTSGAFTQPGYINTFQPGNFLSGLTPAGTLTPDLNIPINTLTYPQSIPPFGGYPGIPGFGGVTLGLAFLSDIQVFLFMEAVQGDQRTNVMQAPKLTLFNGQTANIQIRDVNFFVTGVQVIPQLGQFTYFPQTQLFPFGVTLTIQAVISADRRFVRLSLTPSLSNLSVQEVLLFPVVTPIFPLFDGTATGQPVVFTQFIQQPRVTTVSVQTTVAVPDGGTVLMGGLKRLSEGRVEFGPPVLSKIPYLNRLFRNQAYGRNAESLLIMVTPRIIIQAEEEEKQTGYVPPPPIIP